MSQASTPPSPQAWADLILGAADSTATWEAIFTRLRDVALSNPGAAKIHNETIAPDRLLADSAWDLWQDFPRCAPTVIADLKKFWVSPWCCGNGSPYSRCPVAAGIAADRVSRPGPRPGSCAG